VTVGPERHDRVVPVRLPAPLREPHLDAHPRSPFPEVVTLTRV
jgi:hypothetical protein